MNLHLLSYKIPFKSSFKTSRRNFSTRNGVIFKLHKNGITALGEAAPLPGFSKETLAQLTEQIREKQPAITRLFKTDFTLGDVDKFINQSGLFPSLQFGIFTAASFYLAQKNKQSLHRFLSVRSNQQINLNAVIDLNKSILPQVRLHTKAGFKTIKLKTGTNWSETLSKVEKVRNEFESLNIRLDANRSWGSNEAQKNLKQAEPYEIEYCEEPLKRPYVQNLQSLKDQTAVPIALDETMAGWPDIKEKTVTADVLIIKPMVIGGREKIKTICNFAAKSNKQIVFTSSLGTAIERLAAATLACEFGSEKFAHGLNTGGLLADDVWEDEIFIKNGLYELPDFDQLTELMHSNLKKFSLKSI